MQIGINSGDVVAGIVGRNKVIYDVWGDTINLASALRDHAPPGGILVSEGVHQRLYDLYQFEPVGNLDANGSGKLPAWRLKSTRLPVDAEELTRPWMLPLPTGYMDLGDRPGTRLCRDVGAAERSHPSPEAAGQTDGQHPAPGAQPDFAGAGFFATARFATTQIFQHPLKVLLGLD